MEDTGTSMRERQGWCVFDPTSKVSLGAAVTKKGKKKKHLRVHALIHIRTQIHICMRIRIRMRIRTHTRIPTEIYVYMHLYTHIHIHRTSEDHSLKY